MLSSNAAISLFLTVTGIFWGNSLIFDKYTLFISLRFMLVLRLVLRFRKFQRLRRSLRSKEKNNTACLGYHISNKEDRNRHKQVICK